MKKQFSEQDLAALEEISNQFNKAMQETEEQSEQYWNSLNKEQQLQVFCAVSRRIYKGELEDNGTYRWVLYDVFGFGPEAYVPAQVSGYLEIHNSIYSRDYEERLLDRFAKFLGVTDDQLEKTIDDFYLSGNKTKNINVDLGTSN